MYQVPARPASLDFPLYPSHSSHNIDRRKDTSTTSCGSQPTPVYLEAPIRAGLRTPPEDDMSTTYQYPTYQSYTTKQDPSYSSISASYTGSSAQSLSSSTQPRPYSSLNYTSQYNSASIPKPTVQDAQPAYSKPPSPEQSTSSNTVAPLENSRRKGTSSQIVPSLQIPSTITSNGGNLAEFAAQITCLFWFESTEILRKAEKFDPASSPVKRLKPEAIPTSGFRKWVVSILTTTQVTPNVILLALLFIYRLKIINPVVNGRAGSEYRLLTVALMLGNKFLDDNTYTNKTWAEVSGISVNEIHVMEVEFLSNMRYSLLASKEQWEEWQQKLGKFWTYCDRAMKAPVTLPSPTGVPNPHSLLPSPPTAMQLSPPHNNLYSTNAALNGTFTYNQQFPATTYSAPAISALPPVPNLQQTASRKRSLEDDIVEPPAKRVTRSAPATMVPFQAAPMHMRSDAPRLPVPHLTISTTQALNTSYPAVASFAQSSPSVLPPLGGNRAISSAYPTTPSWTPQLPMLTPTAVSQQPPLSAGGYGTPTRRQSPHSVQDLLSIGSSPVSTVFPGYNPGHISPSIFLQQRASPYKPVRHVNALLYPPPSTSMHNYSASIDQMHYQPLGKRNDYRSGIVPDYTSNSTYQWPILPQPNFHV
ncbi:hypothetical protein F5884DRAFT_750282 [Xylogone sp. PMI_703]|nr:hypothetical protein F5884DRAFT_750282 [Xylogone sp. PMI_703]